MASEQASLDLYKNAIFYKPKDIYLEQLISLILDKFTIMSALQAILKTI